MTFHEIIKANGWTDIWKKLLEFYPDQKQYHVLYEEDYETLLATVPAPSSSGCLSSKR